MKTGYIGLVGLPNAGKSSLLNALIDEKVGIVTDKAQTTRRSVSGILSSKEAQIIFTDTPGFIKSKKGLNAFLQKEVHRVIHRSDMVLCLLNIDAKDPQKLVSVAESTAKYLKPWVILFNKCDLKKPNRILYLNRLLKEAGFEDIPKINISSLRDNSVELRKKILPLLYPQLPESTKPLFDTELFTTQTSRHLAAEIIREKCFQYLRDEVPYGLVVEIKKYDTNRLDIIKLNADILVNKASHKPIVIGRHGSKLKEIGTAARIDLENSLGQKIYLELFVKVSANWILKRESLKRLGYV